MKTTFIFTLVAICSGLPLTGNAQAPTKLNGYASPMADYQPFKTDKPLPWAEANKQVGQIGGWRAYAKEAGAATSPTASPKDVMTEVISFETISKAALPTRLAWFKAVAAQEVATYAKQVSAASQAATELAQRMYSVGNYTRLQYANEQAVYAEAAILLLNSTQDAWREREVLIRTLGLNERQTLQLVLPNKLPELPKAVMPETVLASVIRVAATALYTNEAPSELREAYFNYRTAYDLAKHYQSEILPLRKVIAEETSLRYNGMFMSVFELLADHREQSKTMMAGIAAQLAFWQADVVFQDTLRTQSRPASDASAD